MTEVYKIVLEENGMIKTLFKAIEGSRQLQTNTWMKADKMMSCDGSGGKPYLTGIHCFKRKDIAKAYLTHFYTQKNRVVIKCLAKGLRVKPTNKDVFLADKIYIPKMKLILDIMAKMHTDLDKTRDIGRILVGLASEGPEFVRPEGLSPLEYRRWLTVVVALDYLKDADKLWAAARKALTTEHHMLFEFWWLRKNSEERIAEYLRDSKLSIFYNKDAKYLKQIAERMKWYVDDPLNIIKRNLYDGAQVLESLQEFPYLRGKKLSLFWLRVMHDLVEPKLNIFGTSIPVDVHVAKITLRTGCIKYKDGYNGTINKVIPAIQTCWDLTAMALGTYPSKFDEPLWSISKYICPTCPDNCPIEQFCDKLDVHVTSQKVSVPKNEIYS